MRDKRRGKSRGRIGLLLGIMALLGAILVPGGVAGSTPLRSEVGKLFLHLDSDGKYFRFDKLTGGSYAMGTKQLINGSCPVTSLSGPDQWVQLGGGTTTFPLNQVGLKDNGLGIRYINCGRVDATNWALRLKLGAAIDGPGMGVDLADLDLQGWGNATAVADLYLDGTKVDSVTKAIPGSGTRARLVIDRTGKSLFDEIRLHPKNAFTSIALRGGSAGTNANDTWFRVVSGTDLSVTKTPVASSISVGDDAEFNITVTNASGAGTASNVGVSDTLPTGLTWAIDSQGLNGATNGTACASPIVGGVLSCTIPTITGGSNYAVRVSATTSAPGTLTNDLVTVSLNGTAVATAGQASVNVLPAPPASLTFLTQPENTLVGDCINNPGCPVSPTGAVEVQVEDAFGNPVADGTSVTMSLPLELDPTGSATLDGTLTQATSGGIATFPDLTIDTTSSGYQLQAATTGPIPADSTEFAITNTSGTCGDPDPCEAEFSPGHTVSAPPSTILIIETNQLPCTGVPDSGIIAGTVTIIPDLGGPVVVPITFTDTIALPAGLVPFCKSPPVPPDPPTVPLCNTVNGLNQPDGEEVCVTETVEFTGPSTGILHSVLYITATDPHAKH